MARTQRAETLSTKRWLVGGAAALLALGLGSGQAAARGHATGHEAHATAHESFVSAGNDTAVNLLPMPRGTVSFRQNGGRLEATISTFGLTPGSTHGAEITGGEGAPINFSQFTASATGQASATLTSVGRVPALSRHAVFHIEFSTSAGQFIAQAPVGASRHGRSVGLQAVNSAGDPSLAGNAQLNYNAGTQTLTVRVDARGFLPNTNHAAHVHSGSCDVQGAVIVMLADLHADRNGQIHQTDVVKDLASFTAPSAGWYLNIHQGTSATILNAAGQPTPQFRPLLCANLPAGSPGSAAQGGPGTSAGAGATQGTAMNGGRNPAASAPMSSSTGASSSTNTGGSPSGMGANSSSVSGSTASGDGQNRAAQGGTSPSANGSTPAPTSAPGPTPTTASGNAPTSGTTSSSGNASDPTASGSQPNATPAGSQPDATSAGSQPELGAALHPTGPNRAGDNATVTLQFEGDQICSTLDLPGIQTPVAGEIDRPGGSPLATFGFDALTGTQTFRGCASVGPATMTAIAGGAGALEFKVTAPGTPPVVLQGTLQQQSGHA